MITYKGEKGNSIYLNIDNRENIIYQIETEIKSEENCYNENIGINILEIIYINGTHIQVTYNLAKPS